MSMNCVWLSANSFGFSLLKEAVTLPGMHIQEIMTLAPDAKTKMYDGVAHDAWRAFSVPVREITRIDDEEARLRQLAPDFIVMAGWRQVVPERIIAIPTRGFIGFHPTLLPRGRGPAPIINSILAGYTDSGVTMFYVDGGVDTGDIIAQEPFTIAPDDYAADVYEKVTTAGVSLVRNFLPRLAEGNAPRVAQDESKATQFPPRTLKDNEILETDTRDVRERKVRALSHPYDGAFVMENGEKRVIWKVSELPYV